MGDTAVIISWHGRPLPGLERNSKPSALSLHCNAYEPLEMLKEYPCNSWKCQSLMSAYLI